MKHPALIRALAVVLSVLCLVMLLAGVAGILQAGADKRKDEAAYARLSSQIQEYKTVLQALDGSISYEQAKEELDKLQQSHDEDASAHKMELATYTATKGGLKQGTEALDQADAALAAGWEQYEAGLKEFEAQAAAFEAVYQQFLQGKEQLSQGWDKYNSASQLLTMSAAQLSALKNLGELGDSDDPAARKELCLAAYDGLLASFDGVTGMINSLLSMGLISQEKYEQLESSLSTALGMSLEELRQTIQGSRDQIAASEEISDESFAAVKAAYDMFRPLLIGLVEAMEAQLAPFQAELEATKLKLEAAQAELDKTEEFMEAGKAGIEQGRAALEEIKAQMESGEAGLQQGREMIWYQLGELQKQAQELNDERERLVSQSEELSEKELQAEAQKELEQRETSLRLSLLEQEGIESLVDQGGDLADAAESYQQSYKKQYSGSYCARMAACMLMVGGAFAGIFALLPAFEKLNGRLALLLSPAVCLACALGAEIIYLIIGRGSSYSSIGAALFSVFQLLAVLPEFKMKKAVKTG